MVTLLASLIGFFSSVFPDILKLFVDKADKKHELEILKLQIKINDNTQNSRLEELGLLSNMHESRALYSTFRTGVDWVDALNGTVRPIIAYSFFFLYSILKILKFTYFMYGEFDMNLLDNLWTLDDQAIFAGIISFYYGQRAIKKYKTGVK